MGIDVLGINSRCRFWLCSIIVLILICIGGLFLLILLYFLIRKLIFRIRKNRQKVYVVNGKNNQQTKKSRKSCQVLSKTSRSLKKFSLEKESIDKNISIRINHTKDNQSKTSIYEMSSNSELKNGHNAYIFNPSEKLFNVSQPQTDRRVYHKKKVYLARSNSFDNSESEIQR